MPSSCRKSCRKECCNVTVNAPVRTYLPTVTNSMKWWLAIFLGILFFIFALPISFYVVNSVWTCLCLPSFMCPEGCAKVWGVLIMAILFTIVIRLILW